MRRKGERGHLPGKSIPSRIRPVRVNDNQDEEAGVYRQPVNVDAVMAANFRPEDYIEKFPHGYDPFTDGQSALRKKVVFRPNKHQLDAIRNRKKTISVNADSKVNGQGPVHHEKQFTSKNATYVEIQTQAQSGIITKINHTQPVLDKKSKVVQIDNKVQIDETQNVETGNFRTTKQNKQTQAVDNVTTNPEYMEYEPLFISKTELAKAQYRKSNSIREDFNTKAEIPEAVVEHQNVGKTSRVKNKQHDTVAEATAANFDGFEIDDAASMAVIQRPRRQEAEGNYAIETYNDFDQMVEAEETVSKSIRRRQQNQASLEAEENLEAAGDKVAIVKNKPSRQRKQVTFDTQELYDGDVEPDRSVRTKATRQQKEIPISTQELYQDVVEKVNAVKKSSKQRQQYQEELEAQAEYNIDDVNDYPRENPRKVNRQRNVSQEADYEFGVETTERKLNPDQRRKSTRQQQLPIESEVDCQLEVERDASTAKPRNRRQQAETSYETYYEGALGEVIRPSIGKMKASRQKQGTNEVANVDFELPAGSKQKPTKNRSRRTQAEVTDQYTHNEEIKIYRDDSSKLSKPNRNRRQDQLSADSQVEIPSQIDNQDKSSRKKLNRQRKIEDQQATAELLVDVAETDKIGNRKVNRQRNLEVEDTNPDVIDIRNDQTEKNSNRRRQVIQEAIDSGQVDVDYQMKSQDGNFQQRNKLNRQPVTAEETAAEFEVEVKSTVATKPKRRVQFNLEETSQAINDDFDARNTDISTLNRRRQVSPRTDTTQPIDNNLVVKNPQQNLDQRQRKTQTESVETTNPEFEIPPEETRDHNLDVQHRQQHIEAEQISIADIYLDTRDVNRIPNSRPTKRQVESGVLIAIRNPELDVKTRVQQALERSKRHMATVDAETTAAKPETNQEGLSTKPEEVKTSNRRQYSAKQENETSVIIVSGRRTESSDVNQLSNHRQGQAVAENQLAAAQVDLETGTRLVLEKQKVDGRVDESDVNQHSGMLNPIDEDAGIDPVSLDAANTKKHLAREGTIETVPDTILYEEGASKTGLEVNTRARQLIIDPSIFARARAPIRLKRKVK